MHIRWPIVAGAIRGAIKYRLRRIKQHRMQCIRGGHFFIARRMGHHDYVCQPRLVSDNIRLTPDERRKTSCSGVSVWFRVGYGQAVLRNHFLKQVAHATLLRSVGSNIEHG